MIELKYANTDKSLDSGGWILDYKYLLNIMEKVNSLDDTSLHTSREEIEVILLVANGELDLLKERLFELEDF